MSEYKKSHIELKFKMLALQKYMVLILKNCGISAEELADRIGVTAHLIRDFMSNPARAILPRSIFISIMSILEVEKKRNENGLWLKNNLFNILDITIYPLAKTEYQRGLDLIRSKSRKVLSKATDSEELEDVKLPVWLAKLKKAIDSDKSITPQEIVEIFKEQLVPSRDTLRKLIEDPKEPADDELIETLYRFKESVFNAIKPDLYDLIEGLLNDESQDDAETTINRFNKDFINLIVQKTLLHFPQFFPDDEITEEEIIESINEQVPSDVITDDGIYGWLDLVYSTGKIESQLNDEIDALVLKDKNLDAALERLYSYYLQKM